MVCPKNNKGMACKKSIYHITYLIDCEGFSNYDLNGIQVFSLKLVLLTTGT